jgi:WD40 repeat protein/beta-lactamase regulating signal transducer with metallopeptidase domain
VDHLLEIGLANAVVALGLALLALLAGRLSRRPALVHSLWLLVLLKLVTPPLFLLPVPWWRPSEPAPQPQAVAAAKPPARDATPVTPAPTPVAMPMMPLFTRIDELTPDKMLILMPDGMVQVVPMMPAVPMAVPPPVVEPAAPAVAVAAPPPEPERMRAEPAAEDRLAGVLQLVLVVWLGGAALWLLITLCRVLRFQRLLRHAKPAPEPLQEEAARIAKHLGLASCPRIWLIPGPVPPLLWAVGGRARLFFPQTLLPRLEDTERATLLAHELAHLARRDHWVRLLELLVGALYWWYPLVWVACRRLQAAEEECCDARVVHAMPGLGTAYAGALVETVDFLSEQPRASFPPAASGLGRVKHLKRRLTMIVRGTTPPGLSWLGKLMVFALVLALPLTPGRARPADEQEEAVEDVAKPEAAAPAAKPKATPVAAPVADEPEEPGRYQNTSRVLQGVGGGQVWQAAISPDGKTLAVVAGGTGDNEGTLTLYDLPGGAERACLTEPKPIRCVAFSADGKWLATGDFAQKAQLRDPKTGEVKRVLEGHTASVNSVAFTPDSKTLLTGGLDKSVKLWDVATGKNTQTLTGHTDWVLSIAVSRDGKTLVSGSKDHTARVWDLPSGKLRHTLKGHTNWAEGCAISPDNTTVATTGIDNVVKLWDAATGAHLHDLTGHGSGVNAAVFFPDGRTLATCSSDRTVRFWDVATGAQQSTLETEHSQILYALALSPDGKSLVTGSWDATVKVWDVESREAKQTLTAKRFRPENNFPILSLAASPDGKLLAASGEERSVKLLDARTGQLKRLLEGHEDIVCKVAFAPDSKTLASASFDGALKLWDVASGKCLHTLAGHTNWVFSVAFSPEGHTLASGGYDKTVRLWDVKTGKPIATLGEHKGGVRAVAFSPDGKLVASGGADKTVRVWDVATRQSILTIKGHEDAVRAVAFAPDGKRLASGGEDGTLRLWNLADGKQLAVQSQPQSHALALAFTPKGRYIAVAGQSSQGQGNGVGLVDAATLQERWRAANPFSFDSAATGVAFSPDARQLYASSTDRSIRVWQGLVAPRQAVVSYPSTGQFWFAAHSPDGKRLALGGEDKTLRVSDVRFGRLLGSLALEDAPTAVFGMAVSPDGTKLAAACYDKSVRLWDLKTRKLLANYDGMKDRAWTVAFSHDGKKIAAAAGSLEKLEEPGEVKVWDVASRKELLDLKGVDASCMCVAWSPDGKWLAVGTRDGLAKLYDAATGEVKHTLKGHKDGSTVRFAAFSPDSKHVATGCNDATVRIWRTDTGAQVGQLEGQKSGLNCIDWSRDGKHLAGVAWPAGQPDPEVRLWEVGEKDGQLTFKEKAKLTGHKGHVLACAFSPDGKLLATGGGVYGTYGETMVWDVATGKPLATLHGHSRWVEGLTFSKDGKTLITGGGTHDSPGEVRFWNVGDRDGWSVEQAHKGQVSCSAWSHDGKTLATGGYDLSIKLWDAETGKVVHEFKSAHKKHLRSLSFSPDGKTLASSSDDETVKLWDAAAKKEIAELARHPLQVTCVAFSADGKLLATASGHTQKGDPAGDVRVFEVETGKERENADWSGKGAVSVAFSPDNKRLVTGGVGSNALRVYDVATGKLIRQVQGANSIRVVTFSRDGTQLATAHGPGSNHGNGSVQVWDTATWTERVSFTGHTSLVLGMSFSPDGKYLATASNDKTVKVWDLQGKPAKPADMTARADK